jgi:hypothetical protein
MSDSNEPGAPAAPTGPTKGAIATVVVTIGLLAALVWAISPPRVDFKPAPLDPVPQDCPKIQREFVPSNVTEIPDSSLTGLPPAKRWRALYRMNFEPCPCGCNQSIAYCRVNNPQCETCRKLAEKVIAEVRDQSETKK